MQTAVRPGFVLLAIGIIAAACATVFAAMRAPQPAAPNAAPVDAATAAHVRGEVEAALASSAAPRHDETRQAATFRVGTCRAMRYPASAVRHDHEGTTVLRVLIATDGTAKAVETKKSSGFAERDAAATRSVNAGDLPRRWSLAEFSTVG